MSLKSKAIGIFDSGIGGLTVADALVKTLPNENIIYFGDTVHLPYGDKSTAALQAYAIKIAHMLLEQECKLILIACNSASAAAYELVKEFVGDKALVMNVIDPTVAHIAKHYSHKQLGLIGTRQTVNSHIYKKKIDELNVGIKLSSFETNLLAQAIEEFGDHDVIDSLLNVYLPELAKHPITALILACTHYPLIKSRINTFYENKIDILDASEIVAAHAKHLLTQHNLLNAHGTSEKHFYVSDYTESFEKNARLFFGEKIKLQHYPLWD